MKFERPENLNGYELRQELRNAGIEISDNLTSVLVEADGSLILDIKKEDELKAVAIVKNHNGSINAPELTAADKLAAAGLSIEELKELLGLNG